MNWPAAAPAPGSSFGHAVHLPLLRRVAGSTVEFSGSWLRNAAPHPDQFS